MFKLLFHVLTLSGQLLSTPIYMAYDALGLTEEDLLLLFAPSKGISLEIHALSIDEAKFSYLPKQSISFKQADATCFFTLPINSHSGFLLSSGFIGSRIQWNHTNPKAITDPQDALGYLTFKDNQSHQYISLSAGMYTLAMKNWQWSVVCACFLDPQKINIGYSLFQTILSGRYQATPQLSVTFGMINEAGLHQEKVWPLVGASYSPTDKLTINCIYPSNFSVDYKCTSVCSLGAAYRLTRFRKKLHTNELKSSKGIFEYQGREIEGNVKLTLLPKACFIKFSYGLSVGSDISLGDSRNAHVVSYPFRNSAFSAFSAYTVY